MYRLFISFLFCLFFIQNVLSSDVQVVSNNTKQNIDNLSSQLKYLIQDHKENKKEISDILNLYYQHHERIIGFEIIYEDKYIYSSYKEDYTIFIKESEEIPFELKDGSDIYKKDILNKNNNYIGKLIVYFKKEINFTQEELAYLENKRIIRIQNDSALIIPY